MSQQEKYEGISQVENYMGVFGDKRLDKRASQLSSMLYFGRTSSIKQGSRTESGISIFEQ
jgi:hypothetical protein